MEGIEWLMETGYRSMSQNERVLGLSKASSRGCGWLSRSWGNEGDAA